VALRFIGAARLQKGGAVEETTVVLSTTVFARVSVRASSRGGIQAGVDFSEAVITALDVAIEGGAPPLSQTLAAALRDPQARAVLTLFLQTIKAQQATATPPLLTQVTAIFGAVPIDVNLTTIRALNGSIALAVDLAGVTTGDPKLLTDFGGEASIAVACHPSVALDLFARGKPAMMARRGDVSLTEVNMSFGADYLHLGGKAKLHTPPWLPDGEASFSADARALLGSDRLYVDVFNVDLDIPLWLQVLGFVVGALGLGAVCPPAALAWPVFYPIAAALLDDFAEQLAENTVERAARASRIYSFTLPETSSPACRLRLDAVKIGDQGIEAKASFTAELASTATTIEAPYKVPVADTSPIAAKLIVGPGLVHPADPSVRVRWEAYARPSGKLVLSQDRKLKAADAATFQVPRTGDNSNVRDFEIRCRIYRPVGTADEELFKTARTVYVQDRLNPDKGPYVRWTHWVVLAQTSAPGKPTKAYLGANSKQRTSKIHRTQTPGRCQMAERYSQHVDPFSKKYQRTPLEYLQALPFPRTRWSRTAASCAIIASSAGPTSRRRCPERGAGRRHRGAGSPSGGGAICQLTNPSAVAGTWRPGIRRARRSPLPRPSCRAAGTRGRRTARARRARRS
jgi:hypothetical protein